MSDAAVMATRSAAERGPDARAGAHVRALDGLRFFAFFGVFVFHALQNNPRLRPWVVYGALGVQVFFVLSGFLIGGILLDLKRRADLPLGQRLKTFYARRALRIFPLYYMVLLVLLILPPLGITALGGSDVFWWNAAYLTNLKIYLDGEMMGGLSHFWSLAVEEHFYFIAPLLVLSVPVKRLSVAFVVYWGLSALATAAFALAEKHNAYVLSPLQFDCMTIGIAAAIVDRDGEFLGMKSGAFLRLGALCTALTPFVFALGHLGSRPLGITAQALEHLVFSMAVASLVLFLWRTPGARASRWLSVEPLPYLGKISYGLYVFHFPCLVLAYGWFSPFMKHGTAIPALLMTLGLAAASWRFVEGPINDLKRHFRYAGPPE